ncbi:MAG TPA: TonB-dependent siderophore receptor [Steroidobacteraceae bacterium]|nr:TonB-dependent siderophore receptor [Steroidobacteraceae bacterium]
MESMSIEELPARRLSRAQIGVGSTICLASSFGLHAEESTDKLSEVVVTGHPSIGAYTTSLQDTAQNVTVVPQELLIEQAASTVQDALKNVPGITLNAGEGGTHGDNINLRGFAASDDFFLDGLRDTGFYTRDSFNLEGIEVYKGPASTLFGRGSTGGVVNQVSKTPQLQDFARGSLVGGTNSELRGTADFNYKFADSAAFRVNAMGLKSEVADRDFVDNRRWGVAPSLAFGIGGPTTFTLNYLHQEQNDIPDYGIPFAFGSPVPVPRNTYYGLPSDDRTRSRVDVGTAIFRTEFNKDFWFTDTARIGNYFFDSRETAAHYGTAAPQPGAPLDTVLTFRDRPSVQGTVKTLMNDADLHARFTTGAVEHHVVVGVELDREEADLRRFANQLNQIPGTPVLNPDPFEPFPGHQTQVTQTPDTVTKTASILFEDIVDFGRYWEATAAVRVDRFNAVFNEPITQAHFEHTDTIASPRASIVFKPLDTLSLYASYGTSYDPSAENLSLSAKTASLGPEKDKTFEVGAKSTVLGGRLALQAGVFQTDMSDARVGDPTNPTAPQLLAGKERVRGFEADAAGYLTEELEITAGYTHLDSETVSSTDPASVGAPLLNTASNQANMWLVYEFHEAWKVGAGFNYLSRRAADVDNTAHVPGYVTFDAMARYSLNSHMAVQINGYNLANRYYYANSYFSSPVENHVVPGAGRTALLTVSFAY